MTNVLNLFGSLVLKFLYIDIVLTYDILVPETWYSWTSDLIIEEISTISNTLGAQCISVQTVQQSSVIIA